VSRASELSVQFDECEHERLSYKTELRELKTRESRVMADCAELEDENISLQKQLMQLKQAQVSSSLDTCLLFEKLCSGQGSDTRVRTQKNLVGVFGYTHLKKPTPKIPTLLL